MRVYTDWVLTHRLALELSSRFAGARVQAAGQLPDGRFALLLWQRGALSVLAFDIFAATPVLTVEDAQLTIEAEPGFIRRAGAVLRGMTIESVRSRKGDRVLRLEFAARSRFGVESGYSLIAELVPRFGNLLLVKDQTIVSAIKEFTTAQNAQRSISTGDAYEPPPLSLTPQVSEAQFAAVLDAHDPGMPPNRAAVAAFRGVVPLLPQMVALSLLTAALATAADLRSDSLGATLMERADAFFVSLQHLADLPITVYREDGALVAAHVTELRQFDALEKETATDLLALLFESRSETVSATQSDRVAKRRRAVARILKDRDDRVRKELRDVELGLLRADERETLREQGRSIFATLHELTPEEQEGAKSEAAALFSRYQKLSASIPHLRSREQELSRIFEAVSELQWELERAGDEDLDDVAQAVRSLEGRAAPAPGKTRRIKRKPLSVTTALGSRILVGRSPVENAELTFQIAKPDDLWFHAQKIPGAHVILQRDDKLPPHEDDIRLAASFAAFYSKAKSSPKVIVDFTQRKHVRKRPAAPPGLVFYTNPASITVQPKSAEPGPLAGKGGDA
ncbi:MAG: NFACT RNA binding domain-containing protein [Candidatus Baltobacteraceae bacterium]